ncbi:hypothetical protein AB4084_05070 [Lysobacter sp. 2RAB21]
MFSGNTGAVARMRAPAVFAACEAACLLGARDAAVVEPDADFFLPTVAGAAVSAAGSMNTAGAPLRLTGEGLAADLSGAALTGAALAGARLAGADDALAGFTLRLLSADRVLLRVFAIVAPHY